MKKCMVSWSGGKDSCLALINARAQGHTPVVLLNMMNENGKVSRSHAIPQEILQQQGKLMGLPVVTKPVSWEQYEEVFISTLQELKEKYSIEAGVFGDIDLQEHRNWEEMVCTQSGLKALLPLWQQNRKALVLEMINLGIEAHIVSCNETMGATYLGEKITPMLIDQLEQIGVDACGENGEYHTLVVNAPMFKNKMRVQFGNKIQNGNYWFIEMKLL